MAMSCTRNSINQILLFFFFFILLSHSISPSYIFFLFFFFHFLLFPPCIVSLLPLLPGVHWWFSLVGQRMSAFRHWAWPTHTLVILVNLTLFDTFQNLSLMVLDMISSQRSHTTQVISALKSSTGWQVSRLSK